MNDVGAGTPRRSAVRELLLGAALGPLALVCGIIVYYAALQPWSDTSFILGSACALGIPAVGGVLFLRRGRRWAAGGALGALLLTILAAVAFAFFLIAAYRGMGELRM